MMIIRASALGEVMAPAKKAGELSAGAKTFVRKEFCRDVLGFREDISSPAMEKGITCEQDSIELYNTVHFTNWQKNTDRIKNEWITGECDIFTGDTVIDIKSSWSLTTFPLLASMGENSGYEWQLRAYMMLWDCHSAVLAYCMVSTPEHLIRWEDPSIHAVDHIDPVKRVTRLFYERDAEKEKAIIERVQLCRDYYSQLADEYAAQTR